MLTLAAGVGTGVLSGMFGVGGAVVSTPAIRVLGATPLQSVGSTLPSILPSALSGSLRYRREGLIVGRIVAWVGTTGTFTAVGGSLLAGVVPGGGHLLMIATAALLAFTAYRMGEPAWRGARVPAAASAGRDPVGDLAAPVVDVAVEASPRSVTPRAEWWRLAAIGSAAGALSGLLGIGGGLVMVPAFVGWVRLDMKRTLGTSLACVGLLALPGTVTHALLGHIDWAFAIPLSIAVIPGAQLGAHLAIRSSDRALRLSVAGVLGLISVVYGVGEVLALRG
jgi:uncharacterized membrane protein YfcA